MRKVQVRTPAVRRQSNVLSGERRNVTQYVSHQEFQTLADIYISQEVKDQWSYVPGDGHDRRDINPVVPLPCLNVRVERIGWTEFRRTLSCDTVPWRTSEQLRPGSSSKGKSYSAASFLNS